MNLRFVILPAKVLQDGRHRIRLALSHTGTTRYIMTDHYLASPRLLVNGEVSGRVAGAREINLSLRNQKDTIERAFHEIEGANYMTCAEVIACIKERLAENKPRTIHAVFAEIVELKQLAGKRKNTMFTYKQAAQILTRFFPPTKTMQSLTEGDIMRLMAWMHEQRMKDAKDGRVGYSQSSIEKVLLKLKAAYIYAVRHQYFSPRLDIWENISIPNSGRRDCALSVEELRRLRDADLQGYRAELRDVFMLSFYLCGMNLIDIYAVNLSGDVLAYQRIKTEGRRRPTEQTQFTIQPEARALIDRYTDAGGRFCIRGGIGKRSLERSMYEYFPKMRVEFGFARQFVFYSARHTFAQLCHELGVPDSVLAYCIGDVPRSGSIDFYRQTTRRMADRYIRRVFDFVASDKSIDDMIDENGEGV